MMKLIFTLIFTIYILYNVLYNNTNNEHGMQLVKNTKPKYSKKMYFEKVKRKRRAGREKSKNSTTASYLIWFLIVSGDIELNPGPVTCKTCNQTFRVRWRLDKHLTDATLITCDICNQRFCHRTRMEQHKLTEHTASGISSSEAPNTDLNTPTFPNTGHPEAEEYREKLNEHYDVIRTQTNTGKKWKNINIQISPNFTYKDLKLLLERVQRNEVGVFKINLGFGSMLYDTINRVYRYYYVSHNHYLFDRAFTISTNRDMTDFFNKILSLDLADKYYFQRPSSGWVLAGLPNIEIRLMRLTGVPIGAGIELPPHIRRSKSIVSLTRDEAHGYEYNNNLCIFRCLVLHFGASVHALEQTANR